MAQATAIEWTDLSWNPTHGCSKVSPGCAHCYAETLSRRYKQTLKPWTPRNGTLRTPDNPEGNIILKPHKLREPLSGAKDWQGLGAAAARAGKTDGKLVFVNSMSDLFHEEIEEDYVAQVFAVMAVAKRHTYQVLTKRPERMRDLLLDPSGAFWRHVWERAASLAEHEGSCPIRQGESGGWFLTNVWLGTSIENRRYVDRADLLRETPAAVRFISAEPLLGPLVGYGARYGRVSRECSRCNRTFLAQHSHRFPEGWVCDNCIGEEEGVPLQARADELDLTDIDWLIVGGESGSGHRPMREDWVRDLRDACLAQRRWSDIRERRESTTAFLFKQWGGATSKSGGRELDGRTWDEFPRALSLEAAA